MKRLTGIIRAAEFSPNSNDVDIMRCVGDRMQRSGCEVNLLSETDFLRDPVQGDAYFSMARSEEVLRILEERERTGSPVVNPPGGVRRCARPVITELMYRHGIPIPHSVVLDLKTQAGPVGHVTYPCWLKRGDSSAKQKADVSFVRNEEEYVAALADFRSRGIFSAVLSGHLEGDVVKFYGVAHTSFFYWSYPTLNQGHSKFGLEEINGPAHQYSFDVQTLKGTADEVADFSLTPVYGGDCIVCPDGDFKIIDFNDWPSFSICVEDAASAIAEYLSKQILHHGIHQG